MIRPSYTPPALPAPSLRVGLLALSPWSPAQLPTGAVVGTLPDGRVLLPTNQLLSDPASFGIERRFVSGLPGQSGQDRPVDLALSPDGRTLAIETNFGTALLPANAGEAGQFFPSAPGNIAGVPYSADGKRLYASMLADSAVRVLRRGAGGWYEAAAERIALPRESAPSGLAVSRDGRRLYVALSDDRNHLGSLA